MLLNHPHNVNNLHQLQSKQMLGMALPFVKIVSHFVSQKYPQRARYQPFFKSHAERQNEKSDLQLSHVCVLGSIMNLIHMLDLHTLVCVDQHLTSHVLL